MNFLFQPLPVLIVLMGALVPWKVSAEPLTVIVYGDSIAAGTGLPEAQRSQVWVRRIEQLAPDLMRMVNEGEGGRWTRSTKDFEAMLARQPHADILVLALGTNDSADLSPDTVARAVMNLRHMIARAREAYGKNLAMLIVGPPNIRKDALIKTRDIADQREAKLLELGMAFADLAAKTDCEFVDLYGGVPESSLISDGMHPDAVGNEKIARIVLPALLSIAGQTKH